MPTTDTATYIGEAGTVGFDGKPLISGVTVAFVPLAEARASELWEPIEPSKPSPSNPAGACDGGTPTNTKRHEISSTTGEDIVTAIGTLDGGTP